MLRTEALTILREGATQAHPPLTVEFPVGTICHLVGDPSVARKVLYALGGLLKEISPNDKCAGHIFFDGHAITQSAGTPGAVVVSAIPENQLSGIKDTALEEAALGLESRGLPPSATETNARFFLTALGLNMRMLSRLDTLSGGEMQRVNFASGLCSNIRACLLDGAYDELDPEFRGSMSTVLRAMSRAWDFPIVSFDVALGEHIRPSDMLVKVATVDEACQVRSFPDRRSSDTPLAHSRILDFDTFSSWPVHLKHPLFKPISFKVGSGECRLVIGPNGVGKTTLLRYLAGAEKGSVATSGRVLIDGKAIAQLPRLERERLFAIAFQNPDLYFCRPSVRQELQLGRTASRAFEDKLAKSLRISDFGNANPLDLSRSARKRLSIFLAARSARPFLLLDEPTQSFSDRELNYFFDTLECVLNEGAGVLCVTHDERVIGAFRHERIERILPVEPNLPDESGKIDQAVQKHRRLGVWRGKPEPLNTRLRSEWNAIYEKWADFLPDILEFWEGHIYPWLDARVADMAPRLKADATIDYLDLGCGNGLQTAAMSAQLRKIGGVAVRARGIDWAEKAITVAKNVFGQRCHIEFATGDVAGDPSPLVGKANRPRVTTAFFVLHDLPKIGEFLSNVRVRMGDDGSFLSTIVNPLWIEKSHRFDSSDQFALPIDTDAESAGSALLSSYRGRSLNSPFFFRSFRRYRDIFRESGLSAVDIWFLRDGQCESYRLDALVDVEEKEAARLSDFPACGLLCAELDRVLESAG